MVPHVHPVPAQEIASPVITCSGTGRHVTLYFLVHHYCQSCSGSSWSCPIPSQTESAGAEGVAFSFLTVLGCGAMDCPSAQLSPDATSAILLFFANSPAPFPPRCRPPGTASDAEDLKRDPRRSPPCPLLTAKRGSVQHVSRRRQGAVGRKYGRQRRHRPSAS